jgi:hypothetical protein
MTTRVDRKTVDLSGYPDLVVILLGMRVKSLWGLKMLLGQGRQIAKSAEATPEGLLRHEIFLFSLFPTHFGIRQYWRDPESLLKWTRSDPHKQWWLNFLKDSKGTGFWHETYFRHGGFEAIYDDVVGPIGMTAFAPLVPARGPMFGAAKRAGKEFVDEAVVPEEELYGENHKAA